MIVIDIDYYTRCCDRATSSCATSTCCRFKDVASTADENISTLASGVSSSTLASEVSFGIPVCSSSLSLILHSNLPAYSSAMYFSQALLAFLLAGASLASAESHTVKFTNKCVDPYRFYTTRSHTFHTICASLRLFFFSHRQRSLLIGFRFADGPRSLV